MSITVTNGTTTTEVTEAIGVKYKMSTRDIETVKGITTGIIKDEMTAGFFNTSRNGVTGLSLYEGRGLTSGEVRKVSWATINDRGEILK